MTTSEVAEAVGKEAKIMRRYVRARKIHRKREIGKGPAKHLDALALIAALRKDEQFDDAAKIEAWLRAHGRLAHAS